MSHSSPLSRAEELLREAISLEAEELYLQNEGEKVKLRYRVKGRLVQKLDGFLPNGAGVTDELKALATEDVSAEEDEHLGFLSISEDNRSYRIRVYWFREEGADAVVVSITERHLTFEDLGIGPLDVATLDGLLAAPQGIIIGCGSTGSGHSTTLNAILERLALNSKRVVSLGGPSNRPIENVTHIDVEGQELSEQAELLSGHFNIFSLGHIDSPDKVRVAFELARGGALVLGLMHSFPVYTAIPRFLHDGIALEDIQTYFLGGWSQRLVEAATKGDQVALFYCVGRRKTQKQILAVQEADFAALDEDEEDALLSDAEEKIAAGLTTREAVSQVLPGGTP